MYKIQTLNSISKIGTDVLDSDAFEVGSDLENPDGILVRSMDMHEKPLSSGVKAIARAGAGTNNIPIDKCSEQGIVVFNTPGANANAVKEMVLAGLLISSRKVTDGISWVKCLKGQTEIAAKVEKGKAQFIGPEILGKKLGVIGLGAIGVMVANSAQSSSLGMTVLGFDPYMSVDAAWGLSRSVGKAASIAEIFATCDYVTVHIPLTAETKGMFNAEVFANITKEVRLLNFSRAELVDTDSLKQALADGKISTYVTDFPTDGIMELENVIAIPHLGASTPESEDNCAFMAASQLKEYLKYGSIKNSVNFPDCKLEPTDKVRITVLHKNQPNTVSPLTNVMAKNGLNIDSMQNKSKGKLAYTVMDIDGSLSEELEEELKSGEGILGVRVIR